MVMSCAWLICTISCAMLEGYRNQHFNNCNQLRNLYVDPKCEQKSHEPRTTRISTSPHLCTKIMSKGGGGPTADLQKWCAKMTEGYPGVSIDNFDKSWRYLSLVNLLYHLLFLETAWLFVLWFIDFIQRPSILLLLIRTIFRRTISSVRFPPLPCSLAHLLSFR